MIYFTHLQFNTIVSDLYSDYSEAKKFVELNPIYHIRNIPTNDNQVILYTGRLFLSNPYVNGIIYSIS